MNQMTNSRQRIVAAFGAMAMTMGLLLASFAYTPQAQIVAQVQA